MTGKQLIKFIEEYELQNYDFILRESYGEGEYPISLYVDENSKTVEVSE